MKSKLNLAPHVLVGVYPSVAGGTTPGRKMLQLVVTRKKGEKGEGPIKVGNFHNGSRNVWEAFVGPDSEGNFQSYPADPLYDQLMALVKIPDNFVWETTLDKDDIPQTPKPFQNLLNGKVEIDCEVATEYVKTYEIKGRAADPRRVTYSCVLFDGDRSKESIFAQQGHPMVKGFELEEAERIESEIFANNEEGRQERKQERIESGVLKVRPAKGFASRTNASLMQD